MTEWLQSLLSLADKINITFKGICLALAGKFLQKELIYICKQNTFSTVLLINSSQKDKGLPVKTSKLNFVTFFVYFGNSLLD